MTRTVLSLASLLLLTTPLAEASPAATQLDRLGAMWDRAERGMPEYRLESAGRPARGATGTPVRAARPALPATGRRSYPHTPWDRDASRDVESKRAD